MGDMNWNGVLHKNGLLWRIEQKPEPKWPLHITSTCITIYDQADPSSFSVSREFNHSEITLEPLLRVCISENRDHKRLSGVMDAWREHSALAPVTVSEDALDNIGELMHSLPLFLVTEQGINFLRENSPLRPAISRGAKRYQEYLDNDGCMSFGEWLKNTSRKPADSESGPSSPARSRVSPR